MPRVRKAPTVRERIEDTAKKPAAKRKTKPVSTLFAGLKIIFRPLSPIGKVALRALAKLTPNYFKGAWQELRQVSWPNRRETLRLGVAVFIFALIFGGLVALVDKGLDEVFKRVILR